ncbi:hypothetical protein ACFR9U_03605 [Halorientalis brevis]|uniref:Uncharacterized protein n=1 Tax=Halorientalis brevis TaxID=1126241 RepID=A0ABD6C7N9_9EURY|nr:hypothetical protein [Halorientalis brevis]
MSRKPVGDDGSTARWRQADSTRRLTRRRVLTGGSAVVGSAVAGCSGLPGGESTDDLRFTSLHQTAVFVADGVDLAVPEEIPTVSAANNADLVVVPDDTDVGAKQAVDWLADERVIAVVGDDAEATWHGWARSDEFEDAFRRDGFSDSEPDPSLLVGAAIGLDVTTYRHSWTDGPRDRDVLRALDEDLSDIESRTPQ